MCRQRSRSRSVRRPTDGWAYTLRRVVDYLRTGVVVAVFDPNSESAFVYPADGAPRAFGPDATLTLPDVLPGFELVVRRVFE